KQVHQAVVIDIRCHHTEPLAQGAAYISSPLHLRKRFVAIVVVQKAGSWLEESRNTVVMPAQAVISAGTVFAGRVIDKAADEQIQLAVIIVIKPDGAGCKTGRLKTGLLRHIRKSAVTIVPVQHAIAVRRHEDIGPTLVVVIA